MPEDRPRYHIYRPGGWLNDPNGPIQWQGAYHLFYQCNPRAPRWGDIHWGHAVSTDLAHWRELPLALAPTPGGTDEGGCWSGCAVDNGGVPTLLYTGVRREGDGWQQAQCLAAGSADLRTWRKRETPVIAMPPEGVDPDVFRDPCVWREGDHWCCLLASSVPDVGGTLLLYTSPDLVHWQYAGRPYSGDAKVREPIWTGEFWECPQLFPLGDRHVLLLSVDAHPSARATICAVGSVADNRFRPESLGRFDHGGDYYAPISMLDDQGRRLVWGWSPEARSAAAQERAGWSGLLTLPRVLSLGPGHRLHIRPAPELRALRGHGRRHADLPLAPDISGAPAGSAGDALELVAEIAPGTAERIALALRRSPGGEEETRLVYDRAAGTLTLDRGHASRSPEVRRDGLAGPLPLAAGEPLHLHVFLDRSVVEVYANDTFCLTGRIYPTRDDSLGVRLLAEGGEARLVVFEAWEMGPLSGLPGPH